MPYVLGTVLHAGTIEVPVRGGTGVGLIGAVPGGWVVLLEHDGRDSGGAFTSEQVVLDRAGRTRRLPTVQANGRHVQDAALSPDGLLIARHGTVTDIATGDVVARIPANATRLLGWSKSGLVYAADDGTWLWTPGRNSRKIGGSMGRVTPDADMAIADGRPGCTDAVSFGTGLATSLLRGCGTARPALLSPDGSLAITADARVHPLERGGPRASHALPAQLAAVVDPGPWLTGLERWTSAWENDRTIVVAVQGSPGQSRPTVLIRCTLSAGSCERAGDEFRVEDYQQFSLDPRVG